MNKTILILGGTGMLGQPFSHCLKEAGFRVRIMTRDPKKARQAFDSSFELIPGDPLESGCLEEALIGCYGIHISLPTEVEQQAAESAAKLAPRQGVERITYISGATVAEETRWFPMANRKFLAEKAIRESGIAYTIFCPTWVMESLPMFVQQGRASVFGKQPHPYHWVAAVDIARMAASAYRLEEAANRRVIIHGPEAIRMQEALRRYCAVFHPEIKEASSMPFWMVRVLATLTGNQALKGAGELLSYFEKYGEGRNLPEDPCILGAPATTLDVWLQQRKARER